MAGVKTLRYIQLGQETTAGTECNATAIWRGTGTLDDNLTWVNIEEDVGIISGTDRSAITWYEGNLTMEDTPATFEQILYPLDAGVKTVAGASGGGSCYVYTYTLPTTTANTVQTYTLEAGDNQQEEQMLYSFCNHFTITGKPKEALMVSADWIGRQVATGTKTASLSLATVEEILFSKAALYINTSGGTFGGTPVTSTLLGFDLDVVTGFQPVPVGDGNLYYATTKQVAPVITGTITFEHDSNATSAVSDWRSENAKLLRLKWTGGTLTTAGTSYTAKTFIIDLAIKWEKFDRIGESDGNDIRVGNFISKYNETASDWGKIIVVNELAAIV